MQTYESVLTQIETGLVRGRWKLGDRLPSERALSEEFAVSRASVREALRVLEAMGIVRRSTGSGPDSGAILIDKPAAGLGSAIRLHVASGATPVRDVVEMRLLIETWAAQAVAMRCATEQLGAQHGVQQNDSEPYSLETSCLARAHSILELMGEPDITIERFQQLDTEFHVELVALAGNSLLEATMLGLRKAIQEYVAQGTKHIDELPALIADLHREHTGILNTLLAGNGHEAAAALEDHIEGFYRRAIG